jgi:hypothetical protein
MPARQSPSGIFIETKASEIENDSHVSGETVKEALDTLLGRFESHSAEVEPEQGITGSAANNNWVQTPEPCTLSAEIVGGTYLLSWSTEIMRTHSGGGSRILSKLRDLTAGTTRALWRKNDGLQNGSDSAVPDAGNFSASGDLITFSGIDIRSFIAAGARDIRLFYAVHNNGNSNNVMRVQNQRIHLVRIS